MYEDLHVVVCVSSYRWIYGVKPTLITLSNDADSSLLDNQRPVGALVSNYANSSLLDNQRPAGALVFYDADLQFTSQPTYQHLAADELPVHLVSR